MLKEILEETKNNNEEEINFEYKLVENRETDTFHIIKISLIERNIELIYKHKSKRVNESMLFDFNYDIKELDFNILDWGDIETIRLASAKLVSSGFNVCGNCVRELYKNDYPDFD